MAAGNNAQTTIFSVSILQIYTATYNLVRCRSKVEIVLMPVNGMAYLRLLGEEFGTEDIYIGAKQTLDSVKNPRLFG